MNGPKKPKVMEEIARLNKEKDQLQMQLRDVVRMLKSFRSRDHEKLRRVFKTFYCLKSFSNEIRNVQIYIELSLSSLIKICYRVKITN